MTSVILEGLSITYVAQLTKAKTIANILTYEKTKAS